MAELILPARGCTSISLTDRRALGNELTQMLGFVAMGMGSAGMMIPADEGGGKARSLLTRIAGMVGKLAPVAQQIDFYKSASRCTAFDGRVWHTRQVTHYFSPEERAARKPQPAPTASDAAEGL